MITLEQYFGPWLTSPSVTEEITDNAKDLLVHVEQILSLAAYDNVPLPANPTTNSQVSGEKYGGFRPEECTIGARTSAHKQGLAVDVYDPGEHLDDWITDDVLEQCGLYREHPGSTIHWCHLTTRAPHSGHRTFLP